jgi:hypothetical protein
LRAGMMGGMPMMHGRPMSREEFQRLQAMGGMGVGMPGMSGMPLMYGADPSAMAALLASQGMLMSYDSMGTMPGANGQGSGPGAMHMGGLGHSHMLQPDLPPHLRGGSRPRVGSAGSSGEQGTSNGPGAKPVGWTPVPIPSPAQPQPPRGPRPPAPGMAMSHGGHAFGAGAPEAPANRHALHVWERDAHAGGLPPPLGYSGAPAPPPPRPRPTAEEQEKRAADLVRVLHDAHSSDSCHVRQYSALRSARLPVNLIGSPINYSDRLIGSSITSQSTAPVASDTLPLSQLRTPCPPQKLSKLL